MVIGFIIWSAVCLVLAGLGIWAWNARTPVGFFAGVEPPKVTDVRKYNRAVAWLWFGYAGLMELIGSLLFLIKEKPAAFLFLILGTAAAAILLALIYMRIERKYRQK